jgi:hypothetical protein
MSLIDSGPAARATRARRVSLIAYSKQSYFDMNGAPVAANLQARIHFIAKRFGIHENDAF